MRSRRLQHVSRSAVQGRHWCGAESAAPRGVPHVSPALLGISTNGGTVRLFVVFVGYGPVTEEFKLLSRLHYTKFIRHRKRFRACFEIAMIKEVGRHLLAVRVDRMK